MPRMQDAHFFLGRTRCVTQPRWVEVPQPPIRGWVGLESVGQVYSCLDKRFCAKITESPRYDSLYGWTMKCNVIGPDGEVVEENAWYRRNGIQVYRVEWYHLNLDLFALQEDPTKDRRERERRQQQQREQEERRREQERRDRERKQQQQREQEERKREQQRKEQENRRDRRNERKKSSISDAFALLGLRIGHATLQDVRRARRDAAKRFHPDMGGDIEEMKFYNQACDICEDFIKSS